MRSSTLSRQEEEPLPPHLRPPPLRVAATPIDSAGSPAPALLLLTPPEPPLQEGGRWFDHESFQKAQRSGRVRSLLGGMRGSQIYEVFIRERLALAAEG